MAFDVANATAVKKDKATFDPNNAVPVTAYAPPGGQYISSTDQRAQWKERGEIGFVEGAIRQSEWDLLPFSPTGVVRSVGVLNAVNRLKKNEYDDDEKQAKDNQSVQNFMMKYEEEATRGYTTGAQIYLGVTQLPGFMIEFLATGGASAFAKTAVRKAVAIGAKKATSVGARKVARFGVKSLAGKTVRTGVQLAAAGTARAPFMYNRYIPKYAESQIFANAAITDRGTKILSESKEKPFTSAMRAFGDVVIENASEEAGAMVFKPAGKMIGKMIPKQIGSSLTALFKKIHPSKKVAELFTHTGFDGFIEELGEERVGDLLRAVFNIEGDDENMFQRIIESVPDGEQWLVEAGIFSVPMATNFVAQRTVHYLQQHGHSEQEAERMSDNMSQEERRAFVDKQDGGRMVSEDVGLMAENTQVTKQDGEEIDVSDIAEPPIETVEISTEQSIHDKVVTALFNKHYPIEKLGSEQQNLIRRHLGTGGVVRSILDDQTVAFEKQETVANGEGLKPILDNYDSSIELIEESKKIREQDLQDYMVAQRYIFDLATRKDVKVTDQQKSESLMQLARLNNKYGSEISVFNKTADRLREYQKRVLHTLVDTDILSEEQFNTIIEANPHYIPFQRVVEDMGLVLATPQKGIAKGGKGIKKIKGSERAVDNIYESIIKNTILITDRASRNRIMKSIASLSDIMPESIIKVKTPVIGIKTDEGTVFKRSPYKPKGNVVSYFEGGKEKYLELSPDLYQSVSGIGVEQIGMAAKIMAPFAKALRVGATMTLEFMGRNFTRDSFVAAIQTNLGFKPFIDPSHGIANIVGKTDMYYEWLRSGGAYSGLVETSRKSLTQAYKELTKQKSLLGKLNIVTQLEDLSQLLEQGTRVGVFIAAKRAGLPSSEAGFQSRESTVDFGVHGSKTAGWNASKAFLNASLQAFKKNVDTIKNDPLGVTLKGLAYITSIEVLVFLMNKDDEEWWELSRWCKDLFWNVKIGGTFFSIPKPFGYGQLFGTLPCRFMEYAHSKDQESFKDLGATLFESFSPASNLGFLLPTMLEPLFENWVNYDFFRSRKQIPSSLERVAPERQYTKYSSETAKELGDLFNYSPIKIENVVRGYTGSAGKYLLEGSDFLLNSIKRAAGERIIEKPKELADYPVLRGFVSRSPYGFSSQSVKSFYDIKKDYDTVNATINKFKKDNNGEKVAEYRSKNAHVLRHKNGIKGAYKKIRKIANTIDSIMESDMLVEEKNTTVKGLEKAMTRIANNFLTGYKETKP